MRKWRARSISADSSKNTRPPTIPPFGRSAREGRGLIGCGISSRRSLGLGFSPNASFYAIRDIEEAAAFLRDEYLGGNLRTISEALLSLPTNSAYRVFGTPDDLKLRSSMTLFALVAEQESVFHKVLGKYFGGVPDKKTLTILNEEW